MLTHIPGAPANPSKRPRQSSSGNAIVRSSSAEDGEEYPSNLEAADFSLNDQESGDEIFQHQT